ncbi:hypothetical protein GETHLI_22100 [Geothrix limicola]|uniref:Uncharacterized protein n=1 Tax=Geothrix limicola TaxID=2927978 RepID=A0ABQ5QH84_9BACT|nr:hypothetical protein [Geothrix limicola]GLH73708.1 hypothetical protein GETHLI_22100 [Geothrix limicola]
MPEIFNPDTLRFFFGSLVNPDVAMETITHYEGISSLSQELEDSITANRPHLGLQLVGYHNVDTGVTIVAMMRDPEALSGISFFAESSHRVFGGSTLTCIPLVFCSSVYQPTGNYLVYRHTYKRPAFDENEVRQIMASGSPEEQLRIFFLTKSRNGYESIPGMSYVGITKRSWQERYGEHVEKAKEASSTRFHEAMRKMQGQRVIQVHDVSAFGITEAEAKAYESELISKSTLWPLGLNMKA